MKYTKEELRKAFKKLENKHNSYMSRLDEMEKEIDSLLKNNKIKPKQEEQK